MLLRTWTFGLLVALGWSVQDRVQAQSEVHSAIGDDEAAAGLHQQEDYILPVGGHLMAAGGLKVTWVDESTPAAAGPAGESYRLEAGDIILTIDNRTVATAADYQQAVSACGRRGGLLRISVRRWRTNRVVTWNIRPIRTRWAPPQARITPPTTTRVNPPTTTRVNPPTTTRVNPPTTTRVNPPTSNTASRIKVLIIADTNDPSIGRAISVSKPRVRQTLLTAPGLRPQDIWEVSGSQVSAANILRTLSQIPVRSNETLLVYSMTHGAYNPAPAPGDPSGGHFLAIPGAPLYRKNLLDQMKARNARLTILVTDCCNTNAINPPMAGGVAGEILAGAGNNRVLKNLLLDHVGVIDICASSRNQYSWFSPVNGGVFTNQFLAAANQVNNSGFVTWNSFVSRVGEQANRDFLAMKDSMLRNPANVSPLTMRQIRAQNAMRPAVFVNTTRASR